MRDLLDVCCGLDVHKETVVACLLKGQVNREPEREIREFSTLLSGLNELKEWLISEGCVEIAMESTGVYWFPIYSVLETAFDGAVNITVTNPMHMKNVPGKKTDINDAQWITSLLRAGLLKKSYIPPMDIRELRDLTRYRRSILQEMTSQKNRIEKHLQQCGFKLSTFLSDIFGVSGLSIIKHLCRNGYISPDEVICHLRGTLKNKVEDIKMAVNGKMSEYQREFLDMLVGWYEKHIGQIALIEEKINRIALKFESAITLVDSIPCIERMSAIIILSEIGVNLSMFESAGHLCAWAGMSPGNNESAGKKYSTKVLKGNPYIKNVLCQCAWAATRQRNSYFNSWYWKVKQRRGAKKAIVALGRKMLAVIYALLTTGALYDESSFDRIKEKQDELRKNRIIAEAKKYGLQLIPA
jgi:transposase